MLELLILSVAVVIGIGVILGLVIGIAAKVFAVEQDPKIEVVTELLPGANCGACGFAGCSDFAKALVTGEAKPGACPVSSSEDLTNISAELGVKPGTEEKQVAIVMCGGDSKNAKQAAVYNGVNDCKSAALVSSGAKGCAYGCLGYGTCANKCSFGAIEITENNLAIVHPELCVGCRHCVAACPKNIIKMVPAEAEVHVYCSSPEKGVAKKKVCSVSCIGCRKCVKNADEGEMNINGFLASVNYDNPPPLDLIKKSACPTKCLRGNH